MSAPTSDDFKALIPAPTSALCGQYTKVILQLPVKLWQWMVAFSGTDGAAGGTFAAISKTGDLVFSAAPSATSTGRLLCDGSEVPKATYGNLYIAIGDIYGTAGSSANFKLPDFRAKFPVGAGTFPNQGAVTLGTPVGTDQHTMVQGDLPKYDPHLKAANGTDGLWVADAATGVTKSGVGIGAFNSGAAYSSKRVDMDTTYGVDTPTPVPIVPPALGVFVYIIT